MTRELPFEFTDAEVVAATDAHVARLPAELASKSELLQALSKQLRLPGYFGFNWDALSDCLRDSSWLETRNLVLVHAELPPLPPEECRTYLLILAEAVDTWRLADGRELRVVFPAEARVEAVAALAK